MEVNLICEFNAKDSMLNHLKFYIALCSLFQVFSDGRTMFQMFLEGKISTLYRFCDKQQNTPVRNLYTCNSFLHFMNEVEIYTFGLEYIC